MVDRVVGQLSFADGLARSPETLFDQADRPLDRDPIEALLGSRSPARLAPFRAGDHGRGEALP